MNNMFRKKEDKWLDFAQKLTEPVSLQSFDSSEDLQKIALFIRKSISEKVLNGILTPDDDFYIPLSYINELIEHNLTQKGNVDICDLIDATNLPGEILEIVMFQSLQKYDGFFDRIRRYFFTPNGAMIFLQNILGKTGSIDLKFLLKQINWSEEHLEAILDLMAQQGTFYGYIDPLNNRIYNLTFLDFSTPNQIEKNIQFFERFLNTTFILEPEISLKTLSRLFRIDIEKCQKMLKENCKGIPFLFSSDQQHIYSISHMVSQILFDIYIYRHIPIEFWLQRFNIEYLEFISFLNKINKSLDGIIRENVYISPRLEIWLDRGIDVESIARNLNLDTDLLLNVIINLSLVLGFRIIAGESSSPFLIRGVKKFEVFCQIDTSSYSDPNLYYECQNCRRIVCSDCRPLNSKHECPFCGNIAAFIIDLPRNCPDCRITYTHSFNLVSAEQCYFCKKGPLKNGWYLDEFSKLDSPPSLNFNLKFLIEDKKTRKVPLQEIFREIKDSESNIIREIEDLIIYGEINGYIDIPSTSIILEKFGFKFDCSICNLANHSAIGFQCISCRNNICANCYEEIKAVGVTTCPDCGGSLQTRKM